MLPKPTEDVKTVDSAGWSALHHAIDSSSWTARAQKAAECLAKRTPIDILNTKTSGSQPCGYSCLHFACDGSDRDFLRRDLAQKLIEAKAELESRDSKGNTPLLLASGTGVSDLVKLLIASNAHVGATNNNGCGALQKALGHSLHVANILRRAGAPSTNRQGPWPRGRTSFMSVHVSIFIFLDNGSRALGAVKRGGFLVIVGARALGRENLKIDKCTYVLSTSVRFPRNEDCQRGHASA